MNLTFFALNFSNFRRKSDCYYGSLTIFGKSETDKLYSYCSTYSVFSIYTKKNYFTISLSVQMFLLHNLSAQFAVHDAKMVFSISGFKHTLSLIYPIFTLKGSNNLFLYNIKVKAVYFIIFRLNPTEGVLVKVYDGPIILSRVVNLNDGHTRTSTSQ